MNNRKIHGYDTMVEFRLIRLGRSMLICYHKKSNNGYMDQNRHHNKKDNPRLPQWMQGSTNHQLLLGTYTMLL